MMPSIVPQPDYFIDANGLPNILNKKMPQHHPQKLHVPNCNNINFNAISYNKKLLSKRAMNNGATIRANDVITIAKNTQSSHLPSSILPSLPSSSSYHDKYTKNLINQRLKEKSNFTTISGN